MSRITPTLRIDLNSTVAVYKQIVDSLRTTLVDGELSPGDALPSVRRLAMDLGITFNTVAIAYRQLAEEGWIDLQQGKRAVVIDRRTPHPSGPAEVHQFRQRLRELIARMRADGMSTKVIAGELRNATARLG
jgi:GntR family transcriptional regulator